MLSLATLRTYWPHEYGNNAVAIALVSKHQVQFFLHGLADISAQQAVTSDTLFEIGSVTKPLLAFAALQQVHNGRWQLDNAINQLTTQPELARHDYSLADLLVHRSGLPRLPDNLMSEPVLAKSFNANNPYAHYSEQALLAAAANQTLMEQSFSYSNYGYGLLGYLLAATQQQSLDTLLQQNVFKPLGMETAVLQRPDNHYPLLAKGYAIDGEQVPNWQFDALAGAGATLASITDMATMLKALFSSTAYGGPIRQWLTPMPADKGVRMTPGWMWQDGILWHAGQTGGFCSMVAFDPVTKLGVVILTNLARPVTAEGFVLLKQLQEQHDKELQ